MKPVFGRRGGDRSQDDAAPASAPKPATSLGDLLIPVDVLVARAAYLELLLFQELSAIVNEAPALANKQHIGAAANAALERHRALLGGAEAASEAASIARIGDAAKHFAGYPERVLGHDWAQRLLSCHLSSGFFRDFFEEVAEHGGVDYRDALAPVLLTDEQRDQLLPVIEAAIHYEDGLGDRLAMWGRRIVGDTVLAIRLALDVPLGTSGDDLVPSGEEQLEKLASVLYAGHSRRMNALGLAA
ncbi:ferritin-like fold-containing protein [Pseudoclavibacter helvolus]|uniref:ferritin-like fold-containing protein n=1 Tax=Pseudoclavibacter helvolus TaxID=255205 RepID=UPI003C794D47